MDPTKEKAYGIAVLCVCCLLNVPLQMYVTGQLAAAEKVLIDVGTGYYMEKVGGLGLDSY